jgi:LmbE family N-acetylglucosaminyl deacetylase
MNILFVGAHPDDIEIYCGGTAAKYASSGHKIFFCIATNGNIGSETLSKEEIKKIRRGEAESAASFINAEIISLDIDDEFLIDTPGTRKKFIDAFRWSDPDVVFCHWLKDYNPDHSISGYIVDECIHMASIPNIETKYESLNRIPKVYFMDTAIGIGFEPQIYVDISDFFATKVEMVLKHRSQNGWMKKMFGYELDAFIEIPARYRGIQAGVTFAEAFRPSYRWGRMFTNHTSLI